MIDGVVVKELKVFKDIPDIPAAKIQPGFLMEVLRADDKLMTQPNMEQGLTQATYQNWLDWQWRLVRCLS